ncbi:MAG: UPF0280 family protein [Boseongicola sp.]|nr:MAG: UPF0280 family protein [Boseongicola sp.]
MGPQAAILADGHRLHLQHGPIDLIIGADGDRETAFQAATFRFQTILNDLVDELAELRQPLFPNTACPIGSVARRMHTATLPHAEDTFVTRMAAVAGSVADEILTTMTKSAEIDRAYVNNGGDIALHLGMNQSFTTAIASLSGRESGRITIRQSDPVRGIATSGRHGRSLSLGIADSVTVLAQTAAEADVAATLIANTVDLPDHDAIHRQPACIIDENSDLGARPVVTGCGPLDQTDIDKALENGLNCARSLQVGDLITAAALTLLGTTCTTQTTLITPVQRTPEYA